MPIGHLCHTQKHSAPPPPKKKRKTNRQKERKEEEEEHLHTSPNVSAAPIQDSIEALILV